MWHFPSKQSASKAFDPTNNKCNQPLGMIALVVCFVEMDATKSCLLVFSAFFFCCILVLLLHPVLRPHQQVPHTHTLQSDQVCFFREAVCKPISFLVYIVAFYWQWVNCIYLSAAATAARMEFWFHRRFPCIQRCRRTPGIAVYSVCVVLLEMCIFAMDMADRILQGERALVWALAVQRERERARERWCRPCEQEYGSWRHGWYKCYPG